MKLYFRNCKQEDRELAIVQTHEEAMKIIYSFLEDHNYKSFYYRKWEEEGETMIDVGSHTEFFVLKGEE